MQTNRERCCCTGRSLCKHGHRDTFYLPQCSSTVKRPSPRSSFLRHILRFRLRSSDVSNLCPLRLYDLSASAQTRCCWRWDGRPESGVRLGLVRNSAGSSPSDASRGRGGGRVRCLLVANTHRLYRPVLQRCRRRIRDHTHVHSHTSRGQLPCIRQQLPQSDSLCVPV